MAEGEVVSDGRVDEEKLFELLGVGAEQDALDFKAYLDLSSGTTKHSLGFTKDCMAMMNLPDGGYLIVGVDGSAKLAVNQPEVVASQFDSANLVQRIQAYVDGQIDIRSAAHTIGEAGNQRTVVLIYVAPPRDMLPIAAAKDGSFRESGREHPVIRAGEVYVRESSSTSRLAHRHWPRLLERYTERVRTEARSDIDILVRRVVESLGETRTGSAEIPLELGMDEVTFQQAVHAAIDSASTTRLRRFATDAGAALAGTVTDETGRSNILARLAAVAAAGIFYGQPAVLELVLEAMHSAYEYPAPPPDDVELRGKENEAKARYWRDILTVVFALGALAVRRKDWAAVRAISLQPVSVTPNYRYASWLRHGLVYAARANQLHAADGKPRGGTIRSLSRQLIANTPALSPDVPDVTEVDTDASPTGADVPLDSLCQFDVLWCVVVQAEDTKKRSYEFYPSSAAFHQWRAQPAIDVIATDESARRSLFPAKSDRGIAEALNEVLVAGEGESWNYGGFWEGPESGSVLAFFDQSGLTGKE